MRNGFEFRVSGFEFMKIKNLSIFLLVVVWTSAAFGQTKLKVAYPTTVGSMAVLWVAKDARLFEKHGLEVELIYVAGKFQGCPGDAR